MKVYKVQISTSVYVEAESAEEAEEKSFNVANSAEIVDYETKEIPESEIERYEDGSWFAKI